MLGEPFTRQVRASRANNDLMLRIPKHDVPTTCCVQTTHLCDHIQNNGGTIFNQKHKHGLRISQGRRGLPPLTPKRGHFFFGLGLERKKINKKVPFLGVADFLIFMEDARSRF